MVCKQNELVATILTFITLYRTQRLLEESYKMLQRGTCLIYLENCVTHLLSPHILLLHIPNGIHLEMSEKPLISLRPCATYQNTLHIFESFKRSQNNSKINIPLFF